MANVTSQMMARAWFSRGFRQVLTMSRMCMKLNNPVRLPSGFVLHDSFACSCCSCALALASAWGGSRSTYLANRSSSIVMAGVAGVGNWVTTVAGDCCIDSVSLSSIRFGGQSMATQSNCRSQPVMGISLSPLPAAAAACSLASCSCRMCKLSGTKKITNSVPSVVITPEMPMVMEAFVAA